jgi:hypothetical protein
MHHIHQYPTFPTNNNGMCHTTDRLYQVAIMGDTELLD